MIFGLIRGLLDVYRLAIIAYIIIKLIGMNANKWTELLASVIEPLLVPIRRLLAKYLPRKWQVWDWSPVALFLLVTIVKWLL